ncbi:MAG: cobalt ECF transporter T component CbiQ [Actinobacteria bacterium]|nr:cobalt ECF transporter T component CbiQ [Actinomycetota bacterium]
MRHDFLDKYSGLTSPVHSLEPRAKLISIFALIVICVTTPPEAWCAFLTYLFILALMIAVSHLPLKYVLVRSLMVLPFILVVAVFLPFMASKGGVVYHLGPVPIPRAGLITLWNVSMKSFISVICAIILSSTTPFADLMHGLEQLHVPRFFTTVSAFMYRYVFIIVDQAERMKRARDSRNYKGRWIWQAMVVGHMIASLFLRSQERAERVYQSMCARGFNGTFPRWAQTEMRLKDYFFVIVFLSVALTGRLTVLWV